VWHTPMVAWTVAVTFPGLAPVAQLDRAGGFYPSGCGFDSCRGRQDRGGCGFGAPFALVASPGIRSRRGWNACPGQCRLVGRIAARLSFRRAGGRSAPDGRRPSGRNPCRRPGQSQARRRHQRGIAAQRSTSPMSPRSRMAGHSHCSADRAGAPPRSRATGDNFPRRRRPDDPHEEAC
jgi:hypothetical protein